MINSECSAQLIADAGRDTAVCGDSQYAFSIGGSPTASGGISPYSYTWSGEFIYAGRVIRASEMLDDTTIANPIFSISAPLDSVILYLTVIDQNEDIAKDSIKVRVSNYLICTGECSKDIKEGDSVQISPCCISGGIPPHKYLWTPAESLSDNTVQYPWAKPDETTSYNVTITDSIGCQAWSGYHVFVQPSSIKDNLKKTEIAVYPNPAIERLQLRFNKEYYYNTYFILIDIKGKVVTCIQVIDSEMALDLNGIAPGIYLYKWDSMEYTLASGTIVIK